jgi:hypothetical protein
MPIPASAQHVYSAAVGWFELGNYAECFSELENLPPQFRACVEVMELRCRMYRQLEKWAELEMLAHGCYESSSKDVTFLCHWLWALLKLGRIESAMAVAEEGVEKNSHDAEFCYAGACIFAAANDLMAARTWLGEAFDCAKEPEELKLRALEQPELSELWIAGR